MTNITPHETWEVRDPSKLQTAMDCERKYFFEYMLGWRSTYKNNHLIFGTAWHKAQEYILINGYEDRHVLAAFEEFLTEYRKEFSEDTDAELSPKNPANAMKALLQYVQNFKNDHEKYEVLFTEIGGSVMLTDKDLLYFKMDSILRDRKNNMKFSFEHKTGSRTGRQWEDQWQLKTQVGAYTHVMNCLYPQEEVRGIKIRGTFFQKKENKFLSLPCWKTNDQMQVWMWNTLAWIDRIKHSTDVLMNDCTEDDPVMMAFPMNTENCTKYFGCTYHDFCTAWPNPLVRCAEPPMGFEVDFWDTRAEETTHKMEVK